jgi:hypothetical protein
MQKKLPIGVANLNEIITENYVYVDKSRDIFQLIAQGGKYYFLSRPRRFGKSLLISTLKELFSGNRHLFKGLWIENKIAWEKFPVLHFDFSGLKYANLQEMEETLDFLITRNAAELGITLNEKSYDKKFHELIKLAAEIGKVVILIDEYDKPIIDYINLPDIAGVNRNILKNFYSVIKAMDEYIRFAFLTGVSKFSKVSVFSGLNNLNDITIDDKYATLLGYTQAELEKYFREWLLPTGQKMNLSKNRLLLLVKEWYNGYSWNGKEFVYNPFSILNFFEKSQFQNYWFSSGTPTFLLKTIAEKQAPIAEFERLIVGNSVLESFDVDYMELEALLFQTGYLTIKRSYELDGSRRYELSYPNREVRESFTSHLMQYFSRQPFSRITRMSDTLTDHLNHDRVPEFFEEMKTVFADIPYDLSKKQNEGYFYSIFYLCLRLLGASVASEIETNRGRIDAVLQTKNHIYILEFKMGNAAAALEQIKTKGYGEKYQTSGKPVTLIGIGFDPITRNIKDWQTDPQA